MGPSLACHKKQAELSGSLLPSLTKKANSYLDEISMQRFTCPVTPSPEEQSSLYDMGTGLPNMPCFSSFSKEDMESYTATLLLQESGAYTPCLNYLAPSVSPELKVATPGMVNEVWRRQLCEWCYEVVDHFAFDREVVAIALDYLDRVVAASQARTGKRIGKRDFQLLAVTSLYMALKVHGEVDPSDDARKPVVRHKLSINAFVELSRGFFPVELIEATERDILSALKWKVNPPTSLKFISSFLRLLPSKSDPREDLEHRKIMGSIYDMARYFTELSVCVSDFSFLHKNSVAAYASVQLATQVLQESLQIPFQINIDLQNAITAVTGVTATDPAVLAARLAIRALCPDVFANLPREQDRSFSFIPISLKERLEGAKSPICVATTGEASVNRRKRSRSIIDSP